MRRPGADLELVRIPDDPDLQAWDQADLYALDELAREAPDGPVLLVLDAFGALACALDGTPRASAGDSELSRRALVLNASRNGVVPCPWMPLDAIEGSFGAAVVKVPRQKALLDAALSRVRPRLREGASVLGAGLTRHVHNSTSKSFERWIGPTRTTRARSRARLLIARAEAAPGAPPRPRILEVPGEDFALVLEPGVFARGGLDAGSALLMPHVPRLPEGGEGRLVVDAGCGSGLLMATAARRNPGARVLGTDESHLAVYSARLTLERAGLGNAEVRVDDVMGSLPDGSVDLVLSNPPQHQASAVSQRLLGRFIEESARVLRPAGCVRMVANRHVNLNLALAASFAQVRILDQDRRFMVCEALQRRAS